MYIHERGLSQCTEHTCSFDGIKDERTTHDATSHGIKYEIDSKANIISGRTISKSNDYDVVINGVLLMKSELRHVRVCSGSLFRTVV